jgi:hypothetical protein
MGWHAMCLIQALLLLTVVLTWLGKGFTEHMTLFWCVIGVNVLAGLTWRASYKALTSGDREKFQYAASALLVLDFGLFTWLMIVIWS